MVQDKDDEIIELTQMVVQDSSMETDQEVIELTEIEPDADMAIEDPWSQGSKLDGTIDEKVGEITNDQLEAALERIIEKKFSKTIEKILFEVMEKVIHNEIREIKEGLQKDLDDIGST